MRTSSTSASSPRRSGTSSSTSTISTRRSPAPWEWDLMRLSASLVVAARSRSFSGHQARHAVLEAVRTYRERMAEYASMRAIDVYLRAGRRPRHRGVRRQARPALPAVDHPRRRPSRRAPRAAEDHDPHGRPAADRRPPAHHHAPRRGEPRGRRGRAGRLPRQPPGGPARPARPVPGRGRRAARWSASAASAWVPIVALLEGGSDDDPLFLQTKEAEASVLRALHGRQPVRLARRARRRRAAPAPGRQRRAARLGGRPARPPPLRPAAPGPEGHPPSSR